MNGFISLEQAIQLNEATNLISGSIYVKNIDGAYINCNKFQAQMAGFDSPKDVIGKTDYDLPWKQHADKIRAIDKMVMESGLEKELEEVGYLPNGSEILMLSKKAPLYDFDGKIIGVIGISLDITERKQTESQKQIALQRAATAEEKARLEEETSENLMILATSIVHDMRFPLEELECINNHIDEAMPLLLDCYEAAKKSGFNQMERKYSKDLKPRFGMDLPFFLEFFEDVKYGKLEIDKIVPTDSELLTQLKEDPFSGSGYIKNIKNYIAETLQTMKDNIIKLSTRENFVECDSQNLLKKAISSYPFKPEEKQLINLNDNFNFKFAGIPDLFIRVIHNLINNSLDQIHEYGKGEIYITSEDEDDEDYMIRFIDTASTITMEQKEKMFRPYQTTKKIGTGIGLPFSKFTMKRMDGNLVCLLPEENKTTFLISFSKPEHLRRTGHNLLEK